MRAKKKWVGGFLRGVIMVRSIFGAIALLVLVLTVCAGDQTDSKVKEFAKDIEQLSGSWNSPKTEFGPGITGTYILKLEFKKDSTVGQATVLSFVSKNGVAVKPGPSWTVELKEKDKKRFIVLTETREGKTVELAEIAYEVNGDKVKLTSSKTLQFEKDGRQIDMSGEWERNKADKN